MKDILRVAISHQGPDSLVVIEGEIDRSVVGDVVRAVELVIRSSPDTILIDMEGVSFLALDVAPVLDDILVRCRNEDIHVVLLRSHAVDRVLNLLVAQDVARREADYSVPQETEEQLRQVAYADVW